MQGVKQAFTDWAGQRIACRVRGTRVDEDSREWLTCEVDPHGRDEWSVMGRGRTTAAASVPPPRPGTPTTKRVERRKRA